VSTMTVDWDGEAVLVALGLFDVLGMAEISFKRTRKSWIFWKSLATSSFPLLMRPRSLLQFRLLTEMPAQPGQWLLLVARPSHLDPGCGALGALRDILEAMVKVMGRVQIHMVTVVLEGSFLFLSLAHRPASDTATVPSA
jgi:hypothetical protein